MIKRASIFGALESLPEAIFQRKMSLVGGGLEGPRPGKRAVVGSIPGPRGSVVNSKMRIPEIGLTDQVFACPGRCFGTRSTKIVSLGNLPY